MSDMVGMTKRRARAAADESVLQEQVAVQLLDEAMVPTPTLRKITRALGTKSREESAALVRADIAAAKLAARIIRTSEPGEKPGAAPPIATTNPVPAAPARKGRAGLKF